MSPPDGAHL